MKLLFVFIIVATLGPLYYGLIKQIIKGEPWNDRPMSDTGLLVTVVVFTLLMAVVFFLMFNVKLKTIVKSDGIHISFKPFIKERLIIKSRIADFKIRNYKSLSEYRGWGLRYSTRYGRAYNMSGNIALQLYLVDGKKVLIGTQRPDAIKRAMEKMMNVQ